MAHGDLERALVWLGRNEAPVALYQCWIDATIDDAATAEQLAGVWSMVEWPLRTLEADDWGEMF